MSVLIDRNGVASIGANTQTFVGTTSDKGQYPPTGVTYDQFAFKPEPGESSVLIFHSRSYENLIKLHRVSWDDGKLVVDYNWKGRGATNLFGYADDLGLVVQEGPVYYVTGIPQNDGRIYRKIHLVTLVKYIEGKIDWKELNRHALKFKLAQVKQTSLETQMRSLETQLRNRGRDLSWIVEGYGELRKDVANLRTILRMIPRWLRPIVSYFQGPRNAQMLAKVWGKTKTTPSNGPASATV